MSHTPHELHEEFPEQADEISRLKVANPHFAKLVESYHGINREIHRGETDMEPMSDEHMIDLRKQRLALLDQIKPLLDDA